MIFETERLIVRKLILEDLKPFHQLESNPLVLQYATGDVKSFDKNKEELNELISKYNVSNNDFWIYAIERKSDAVFVGTVALVKDNTDDEIGYRFLEKFWNKGYATEICKGLILYCKTIGIKKIIGYVVDKNIASIKIIEKQGFVAIKKQIADDLQLPETKYELYL
ncbi:GNAT family N-acetyltransferase [Polaribacter uvawellassae]|uniref:GNAT family N-acetyltransferase n=1 Tax=Polaribacter uvawellassae TaxID=3133495 RepID=UPI00321B912D